jgi:signal peptidase I
MSEEAVPEETTLPSVGRAPEPSPPRSLAASFWDLLHDVSITVLFCFFFVTFVGQAVRVQGASMQPQIDENERLLVNKFIYRFSDIARGDIVVFFYPRNPSVSYIKRVIGRPGDVVEIRDGRVHVNDVPLDEPYLRTDFKDRMDMSRTTVEPGHFFVMGDHRNSSLDSRSFGTVPEKYIYGKAVFRVWPLSRTGPVH